jgi:hypothetical protein
VASSRLDPPSARGFAVDALIEGMKGLIDSSAAGSLSVLCDPTCDPSSSFFEIDFGDHSSFVSDFDGGRLLSTTGSERGNVSGTF